MRKKISILVFILMLVSQTIFTSLGIPLTAQAKSDEKNIFTDVKLLDEKGNVLDSDKYKDNIANKEAPIKVNYEWSLDNIQVKENDSYSFELPAELAVENEQRGSVKTEQNIEIGTFYVGKDKKGQITFTKQVEDYPNAHGVLSISTRFNEKVIENKDIIPITFMTVKGQQTINVAFLSKEDEQIAKKGKVVESNNKADLIPSKKIIDGPIEIKNSILSKVVLKDKDGKIIDANVNPELNPTLGSDVQLEYEWALDNNHGYKAGSTFTFKLPDIFKVYSEVPPTDLKFGDITVGIFTVKKDGTVTVTFNEEIERRSDIHGKITLNTAFKEQFEGSIEQEIIFPIKDGKVEKIPVRFKPKDGPAIDKKGLTNKVYNATEITWTVDFNKAYNKINQAVLQDPIEEGQSLQANSIKLYKLHVNFDGTVSQGEEINSSEYKISKISGKDFQLQFNSPINSAYRVVYKTDITNEDQKQFKNTATLSGKDFNDLSASATVNVGRGTPLEKKSARYDEKEQTIDWEIKYNYNEKLIGKVDAFLEDTFNSSQSLVEGSLNIYKIKIDENGNEAEKELVPANKYTLVPISEGTNEGFKVQFLEDINAAYKIEYKTKADERVFDKETIQNKVKTHNHSVEGTQNINQSILIKSNTGANYKEKTTSWSIVFNKDKHEMKDVKLTDIFPNKGLTLQPKTLKIVRADGYELERDKDYVLDETNFTITFTDTVTQEHKITYTTAFDYEAREDIAVKNLTNKVTLNWLDKNNEPKEKTDNATFVPDEYTQNNGYKNGSYNAKTKEITWNIGINYNLQTIKNAVLEDYILSGQKFVKGSLKVYDMSISGGNNSGSQGEKELKIDEDYTVERVEDTDGNPGFRIHFKKDVTTPYTVTYKTTIEGQHIQKEYKNTANLTSSNDKKITLDASVSVKHGEEYVSKSGQQQEGERIIDWQVNINFGQSKVENAKIIDKPSSNQLLLEDTFHLYETTVDEKGNVEQGKELKRNEDYELHFKTDASGSPIFEVHFKQTINKPYILKYSSYFNDESGKAADNEVIFEGDEVKTGNINSNNSIIVKVTTGSGTGSGKTGSLEIVKVANNPKDQPLEGAEFTLYDRTGKYALKKGTTDKDGKVIFTNLIYDDYVLKENKAPEGYVVGIQNQQKVTIQQDKTELKVVNKKIVRHVELIKYDKYDTNIKLEGVKFNLLDKDGKIIRTDLTDKDGKIYLEDLEPGQYKFVEVEALDDYIKIDKEFPFTIEEKQTEIDVIRVENELISGSVQLTKIDKDNNDIKLPGAIFNLLNSKGQVIKRNLKTDDKGMLTVSNLQPGDYKFVETKAPDDYELDATPVEFTIDRSQKEIKVVTKENKLIPGSVELTKVDKDDKEIKLGEAEFELQTINGEVLQKGLKTDEFGKLRIPDLRPGDYQLVETKAPVDYELDKTPVKFKIDRSQKEIKVVTKENKLTPGVVELTKIDKDDKEIKLGEAEFELQTINGEVLQKGLKTDEFGKLRIPDLRPGDYQLVETKAPADYEIDKTPVKFKIDRSQKEIKVVTKENKLIPGSVELKKVDKDNETIKLKDAKFHLERKVNDTYQFITEEITDGSGKIKVSNLRPGDYRFVEIEAPADYALDKNPIEFTIERSQKETLAVTAENELARGAVQLIKVDSYNNALTLEGAKFKLLDSAGKVVGTPEVRTTDKNGSIIVEDLKPGDYTFEEIEAPFGYNLDATPIKFTIVRGQKEMLTLPVVPNTLTPGTVELIKVSANSGGTLSGAEFELQDSTGKAVEGKSRFTTDANGKITVPGLRPGTYQFVETKAPSGYYVDTTPIVFTIDKGQSQPKVVTAKNTLITGSAELTKVDKDNNEIMLEGAEFALQDIGGNVLQSGLTTDKSGKIVVSGLVPGSYQFVETKAPFGYELDETPIKFTVTGGTGSVVAAENELITSSVELTKVDAESNNTLAGAEFELQDSKGNVVQKGFTTNEAGKIVVSDLKPGDYQFVETKAPFGYDLDETPIKFTIEKGQIEMKVVTAKNELTRGSIELTKVDSNNNEIRLSGAEFELRDASGNVLQSGLTTDVSGKIIVKDLKPGTYQFVETKAPIGYTLNAKPITFTIEKGQSEMKQVVAQNEKTVYSEEKPNRPEGNQSEGNKQEGTHPEGSLPNTSTNMFNTILVGIGLLIVGLGLFISRRKV
jgi:LPXTG-motif cell wall-anchored protein